MSQLIQISNQCLMKIAESLTQTPWENEIQKKVQQLQTELQTPCLIAVCGEARAGKSTFINAFLGVDLAKTGVTETTATLTYFKYGPQQKHGTVICYWKDGKKSIEDISFVNDLQGHEEAVMEKTAAISHIEILLNSPALAHITLVDTPGSGSLVSLHEQNARAIIQQDFKETQQLSAKADAVIYLMGHVGKLSDSEFIKEFRGFNRSVPHPMNTIGVMAKVDRSANILNNRWRFAKEILSEFPEFNTVIPVSALLEQTVKTLEAEGKLKSLQAWLRRIPRETCEELLEEREFFDEDDSFDDCPFSPIERRKKRSGIQWTVFQLIARTLMQHDHPKALTLLMDYAGYTELRKILRTHFVERAQLLKCTHIISQLHLELMQIHLFKLNAKQKEVMARKVKIRKFNALLNSLGRRHKMPQELVELIQNSKKYDFDVKQTQSKLNSALKMVESVLDELTAFNDDFAALQLLMDNPDAFSEKETEELAGLFDGYGFDPSAQLSHMPDLNSDNIIQRQLYWQAKEKVSRRTKRIVAEQAVSRYSRMLAAAMEVKPLNRQEAMPLASMALN